MAKMILNIPEMTCGHCRAAVTEALAGLDPAATVSVDLEARQAEVATQAAPDAVLAALQAAGYTATVAA